MTQDEIIRMARDAGFSEAPALNRLACSPEKLERFAALVAAHEREACAKVCERLISGDGLCADDGVWIHDCAAAIRARGE